MMFKFIILLCLFVFVKDTDAVCNTKFEDLTSIVYSGSLNSIINTTDPVLAGLHDCVQSCNSYYSDIVAFEYTVLLANNLCFCRAGSLDDIKETLFTEESTCPASECNTLSSSCPLRGFTFMKLTYGIQGIKIQFENLVQTNKKTVIKALIPDDSHNSTYRFHLNSKYTTEFLNVNEVSYTYRTPGYHKVTVEAQNKYTAPMPISELVYVQANISNARFESSEQFVAGIESSPYLDICGGTDHNVDIDVTFTNAENKQNPTERIYSGEVDVPVLTFGASSIEISAGGFPGFEENSTLFIAQYMMFTETGTITALEFFASKTGPIQMIILKPKTNAMVAKSDMSSGEIPILKSPYIVQPEYYYFTVVNVFMFNITATGYQMLPIKVNKLKVRANYMLGYLITSSSGNFQYQSKHHSLYHYVLSDTSLVQGLEIPVYGNYNKSKTALLRIYVSKCFRFQTKQLRESGYLDFKASLSNPSGLLPPVTKRVPVQLGISGLKFEANYPSNSTESGYNQHNSTEIRVSVASGSLITYYYQIGNLTAKSKYPNATFPLVSLPLGLHKVEVRAENNINYENITTNIIVLLPINGVNITIPKYDVELNDSVNTLIVIKEGSSISLIIDYDDKTVETKNIENAESIGPLNLIHRYSTCGEFKLSVMIKNFLTIGDGIMLKKNISVFCPVRGLLVRTEPIINSGKTVLLTLTDALSVSVSLTSGSSLVYTIIWGDGGDVSTENSLVPEKITKIHHYKKIGNFTVTVSVGNRLSSDSFSFFVIVKECNVPSLFFAYGTREVPLGYNRGVDINLIGTYNVAKKCEQRVEAVWKFIAWNLYSNDVLLRATIDGYNKDKKEFIYTIPARSRPKGNYEVVLKTTFDGEAMDYKAYIILQESPLVTQITNGLHRQIAFQIGEVNETSYYNFTLNGATSYDPDDMAAGIKEMTFKWDCRLVSNATVVNNSLVIRAEVNKTLYEPNYCRSRSWEVLQLTGMHVTEQGKIRFNTEMFLETITYEFKLTVTKDTRSGSYVQKLELVLGMPPNIQMNCVVNCEDKINPMERTIYKYGCETCGTARLIATWSILVNGVEDKNLQHPNASSTGFDKPNLVINANYLSENKNYSFIVTANFEGKSAKSMLTLFRPSSSRPTPGTCSVFPRNGTAAETRFKIECEGWKNNDVPTFYEFRYDDGAKPVVALSSTNGQSYTLLNPKYRDRPALNDIQMPVGDKYNKYKIRLIIRVLNKYGSYAVVFLDITVNPPLPPPKGEEAEYLKKLLESRPADVNNTQAVSAFVSSTMSVMTEQAKVEAENVVTPPVNSDTGLPDKEAEEKEKQAKRKQVGQRKKAREESLQFLSETPVKDIFDLQVVTGAIGAAMSDTNEISPKSQELAANKLLDCVGVMANVEGLGAEAIEQNSKSLISSCSLVLEANTAITETENKEGITNADGVMEQKANKTEQDERSKKTVELINTILGKYMEALSKNKVPGEKASIGSTGAYSFSLQKTDAKDLGQQNISSENGYGFSLPGESLFNKSIQQEELSVENTNFKKNQYTWDGNNSNSIKSEVVSLNFKAGDAVIPVHNTKQPIGIKIKNRPEDMVSHNISLYMPMSTKVFQVKINPKSCNMLITFKALNDPKNLTRLIVYIQYGKPASVLSHDVKLNISGQYGLTFERTEGVVGNQTNITNTDNENKVNTTIRKSNLRILDDTSIVMWDFANFTYGHLNSTKLYFVFKYEGPMPERILEENYYTYDIKESRGAFNFSMKTMCSSCSYWHEETNTWKEDGCKYDPEESTLLMTSCKVNHLTGFGGFYVAANPLPTPSLALLKSGYVLLVTVSTIILFWIFGLVLARRSDRNDITKIGVCPLVDNKPEDNYLYEVTVNTGSRRYAGTKSNVYFTAAGDLGESGVRRLKDSERLTFQRSSSDVFIMTTSSSLGNLQYIRIWHDNKGGGWYLRNLEIIDLQTEQKFVFIGSRWLSVDQNDGALDCLLPVSEKEELTNFNYLFVNKTRRDLSDAHIWFSIYARPPRSSFTRCQRLSVAISLLFCAMLASVMFYGAVPKGTPETQNKVGSFTFTWQQVYVAIISACITIPINLILVGIFRSIRPFSPTLHEDNDESVTEEHEDEGQLEVKTSEQLIPEKKTSVHIIVPKDTKETKEEKKKAKKKEPLYLPRWFLFVAWFLCVGTILGCGYLVVLYGLLFGNKKSLEWLSSVTLSLIQDVIIIQPLKVFVVALFVALVIKKLEEEEKSEVEKQVKVLAKNEKWLTKLQKEASIFDRVEMFSIEPPDLSKIDSMRAVRLKEKKMYAISRELILYMIFTFIVFIIGYMAREPQAYFQTRDIEELFRLKQREGAKYPSKTVFKQLASYEDFWPWAETLLLPELFPKDWYNLSDIYQNTSKEHFPGKLFLNDLSSKIVNGVRFRQVRVKADSCKKSPDVAPFITIDCAHAISLTNEENRDFNYNWSEPANFTEQLNPNNKPWRYQTWSELDAYPIWAELGTYFGGGYVAEVFPKWKNKAILESLKKNKWLDRHSRAVIVEFALFNTATNHFNAVIIVLEFPPSGGFIPFYSVVTFKLYRYTTGYAFVVISCEVAFILCMILFAIREIRLFYRIRGAYFKEFWNLVEMSNIILSIVAVFFYFYRDTLAKNLLKRLPGKVPNVFINFQFAASWDLFFTYIVALICFFVSIKFIKLLRFNKRISMLSSTLKAAWFPLAMFGILFGVIISAVVCSSSIMFGSSLYGYRNNFKAVASIISLLLGKFSYHQFESTNRILGPIFFLSFNIMVNWIIMNMFISILDDTFADVQAGIALQENEYEMIDFITNHLKGWFGFGGHSKEKMVEEALDKQRQSNVSLRQSTRSSRLRSTTSRRSRRSMRKSNQFSRMNSAFDDYDDSMGLAGIINSSHWKSIDKTKDFLMDDEMNEDEIDETVNKFVDCINLLYFDDTVARKMNKVVQNEMNKQ